MVEFSDDRRLEYDLELVATVIDSLRARKRCMNEN